MSGEWRLQFYSSLFLTSTGLAMYLYFVPLFAQKFGATFLQLGFIGTASALTYVVATVIVGHFADRVSHMWLYALALLMNAVATVILIFSHSVSDIIMLRAFGGVGLSFLWPTAEVLVIDLGSEKNRVKEMGTYSVVWGIGFLIGPAVGGAIIPTFGFTNLFLLSSILILIGFIQAVIGIIPHAKPRESTSGIVPNFIFSGLESSARKLWSWYFLIALYAMIFAVVTTIFPGYANSVGVTAELIGILFTVFGVSRIAIFATIQHYVRLGEARVLTLVSLAISGAILVIAILPQFFVFLPALIILGASFAVIFPISITMISRSFTTERSGIAIGSYESVYGLGSALGPVFAGAIAAISTVSESFLAVAVLGLLMAAMAQLRKP
jgi:DHA1 family multidrug resistance protein-like MFS transporter/DHA1 family quinolone resistance protein-like MFS transporter